MGNLILTDTIEHLQHELTCEEIDRLWNVIEDVETRIEQENKPVYLLIEVAQEGNKRYEPHVLGTIYYHEIYDNREDAEHLVESYADSPFWNMFVIEVPNREQAQKMVNANKDRNVTRK